MVRYIKTGPQCADVVNLELVLITHRFGVTGCYSSSLYIDLEIGEVIYHITGLPRS